MKSNVKSDRRTIVLNRGFTSPHETTVSLSAARKLCKMAEDEQGAVSLSAVDTDLAVALRSADQQAFAALFDHYGDRIFNYCVSMCGDQALAADATGDTFLLAFARIRELREPDKFRPWVYAIARSECLRQVRENKRSVQRESAAQVSDFNALAPADSESTTARMLIDDAVAGMTRSDREVIDLALRQDLDTVSIAAVLRTSDSSAQTKVRRAKSQLEQTAGALLLFRDRASGCRRLDTEIGPDSAFTPLARSRISKHVGDCSQCAESRSESIAAIELVGLSMLGTPDDLRMTFMNPVVMRSDTNVVTADDRNTRPADPEFRTADEGPVAQSDDGPIYISQAPSSLAPLTLKDRAAQLNKSRPGFGRDGWPRAHKPGSRRWPLAAVIAVVLVVMAVATGLAITGTAQTPAAPRSPNPTVTASPPTSAAPR